MAAHIGDFGHAIDCVYLYCRISKDKNGRVEGVRNQAKWGREYAARVWPGVPVRVFADNDISAFDEDAYRPEYERLREALKAGEDGRVALWAVEQSRLQRREVGWFQLAAELDAAGIMELHTNRDGIVRVMDEVAGVKAVFNAASVRKTKKRINDKLAENARMGLPAGSRPYGYEHGVNAKRDKTLHIVKAEAAVIREAADWVLAGWSLSSIAAELRERDCPERECPVCPTNGRTKAHKMHGPHLVKVRDADGEVVCTEDGTAPEDGGKVMHPEDGGKPVVRPSIITNQSVKSWVTNPTVAGKRVHRGEVVGVGNWEPILDEDTWRAARNMLAAPRVVQRSDGGTYPVPVQQRRSNGRRYLFTGGCAVCGVCQAPLIASMKQLKAGRRDAMPYYLCHPKTGGRACIGIMGEAFEAYVVEQLLGELDKPRGRLRRALKADAHAGRRDAIGTALAAIDEERIDLTKMWTLPFGDPNKLTTAEWQAARSGLAERERRLRGELASIPPSPRRVDPAAIVAGWEEMNLGEQREFVAMFIDRVEVSRAKPGTKGFDESRVAIVWRRL
jgi:site-specific DNA recombinase